MIDYSLVLMTDDQAESLGGTYLAAFRDPNAVHALNFANPKLRACLMDAGIAPVAIETDTPTGYYPVKAGPNHAHLCGCIVDALESDISDAEFEDPSFDTLAFLKALGMTKAYGPIAVIQPEPEWHHGAMAHARSALHAAAQPMFAACGVLACAGWLAGSVLLLS